MLSVLWEMVPLKSVKLGLGHLGSPMASTAGRLLFFECLWFSDLIGPTKGEFFPEALNASVPPADSRWSDERSASFGGRCKWTIRPHEADPLWSALWKILFPLS